MYKVFTAFSGYDSQCMALDRLKVPYELIGWSEIDKYAIQAHNTIYPQWKDRNFGDISKIKWDEIEDFDIFTYSSPCQNFSVAGKQEGGVEGSGTRSSLLWECQKAISIKKPKYLIMENVAALVSNKFIKLFNKWQLTLENYGYTNYAKVLNAKDYGVPQNRKRIFMVSVRNDINTRFYFQEPFKLERRLKDILEKEVDDKYYLSEKTIKSYIKHCERKQNEGCVFKFEPFLPPYKNVGKTITVKSGSRETDNYIIEYIKYTKKIRRLTPRECFRLMDVSENNINKLLNSGISNSQLYKLAGNSIVVSCLYHIFRKLLVDTENENIQLSLF